MLYKTLSAAVYGISRQDHRSGSGRWRRQNARRPLPTVGLPDAAVRESGIATHKCRHS